MPDDNKSLGDAATFAGQTKRRGPDRDVSLGDERTVGGGDSAAGIDTTLGEVEVVDLESRYKSEGTLGQGGMGDVLLATDTRLDRKVAIKRILGEAAGNRMAVQRFLTEAKSVAALNHPNVVQIYDYGRAKDGPFLIMEYVDGGSLLDRCKAGALPLDEAIGLACQLCDGLGKAHDLGIIHRDIKPANVLLTKDGIPKLTDFGLAKAEAGDHGQTMTGAVLGTPDFMPPEQRRDASEVDHRSDLWSLAATVYQMVTGRSPKIIRFNDIPAALQEVLAKALEDRKDDRYQSALAMQDALLQAGGGPRVGLVTHPRAAATDDVQQEGRCGTCGTTNTDLNRKFCRKCGGPLRVPCLKCDAQTPVWEAICGECGANQPQILADLRATLDRKRARAERLAAAGSLDKAIVVAMEIATESHPLLADVVTWGAAFARDTAVEIDRLRAFASRQLADARQHAANRDDTAAIAALESIPEPMRDGTMRALLTNCTSRLREATRLIESVRERVAVDDLDGLLPSVARILELRGEADEFVDLQGRLVSRRDTRLRAAQEAIAGIDLKRACAAVAGCHVEDFDDDGPLVRQLLTCAPFAATLSEAILSARRGDFVAAATALHAIPEPSRGTIVPGETESVATFLERVQGQVHRGMQRQERQSRHAARREQIAGLRAAKDARRQETVEACAKAGIAAETRCVFQTTAGPMIVVLERSWNPTWVLWFASAIRAGAFDAAAVRSLATVLPVSDETDPNHLVLVDWAIETLEATLRVVPDSPPPAAHGAVPTPRRTVLERRIKHGLLVAIDCPSDPRAYPAVVLNASGSEREAAIGWIDQDASVDALAAFRHARNLHGSDAGTLLGVVKAVRLAAPPECWDLTPRLQQGLDLATQSRWEESVAALEAAVAEDPQDVKAWVGIGQGLKQLGRLDEAVAAMERAFVANPRMSLFLYNLACYHSMAGHAGPAVECLAKAVAMRPEWQEAAKKDSDFSSIQRDKAFVAVMGDREPARQLQAELKRGLALADRGRCEDAVLALRGLADRHPHVVDAWVALGRCLQRLNRPGDAAEVMRMGLEAARRHPRLTYNLACYHSLAGHRTESLRALMTAIALNPKYAETAAEDRDLDTIRSDPRFAVIVSGAAGA